MRNKNKALSFKIIVLVWWIIGPVGLVGSAFLASLYPTLWLLFAVLGTLPMLALGILMRIYIFKPLALSRRAESKGEGSIQVDLTSRYIPRGAEELRNILLGMNRVMGRMHRTIYDIVNVQRLSNEVATSLIEGTRETIAAVRRSESKLDQVAKTELELEGELQDADQKLGGIRQRLEHIGVQVQSQDGSLARSSSAVEQMVASIQSISSIMQSQTEINGQVGDLATESNKSLEQFVVAMQGIQKNIEFVQHSIGEIQDISEQTSLLAMNASIEAAHAGEHGKGFSVVAVEMRHLSERAKQNSQVVVGNLSSVAGSIREISAVVSKSQRSFSNLFTVLQTYRQNVEHVTESLIELDAGTAEILKSLEDLQHVSGEVSEATGEIIIQVKPFSETMNLVRSSSSINYRLINETKAEVEFVSTRAQALEEIGINNSGVLEALKRELAGIKITDLSILTAVDNQRLVYWDPVRKIIPQRPDRPEQYPENDSRHWWDSEFAGWNIQKMAQPESMADGPEGKRIAYMMASRIDGSTYVNALQRGAEKVGKHHGIDITFYFADFDQAIQAKQIDQAIASGTDLIILQAIDTEKIHPLIVRLYKLGIPVINSLQAVGNQTFPYILNFTGPDDWGQTRRLAQVFADGMGKKGGYAILQHVPGSSTECGRTYGAITELQQYAPQMVFLEKQYPDFKEEKAYVIVKDLVNKYGNRLNGLYCGDDNLLMLGAIKALRELDRTDIIVCAAGNSKVGMDFLKARAIHGINYQSAESAGALPVVSAIDWFNGVELPAITYLPVRMITQTNVDQFYPPQF